MVIVTGGSRGIGRATAERFAAEGADVVIASRTAPPTEFRVPRVTHVTADVSRPDDVTRLIATTADAHGRLDVLVNNASIEREGTVEETSLEAWLEVIANNLTSVFLCCKAALPHLCAGSGGAIVNVASISGSWAEPRLAAYCAAKAGVIGFTRSLAIDYSTHGIRANCVCPSYVQTEMIERYYDSQPSQLREQAARMHPLGRIAQPEEVAAAIVWLASGEASFATGHALTLDGGLLAGRVDPSPPPKPSDCCSGTPEADERS